MRKSSPLFLCEYRGLNVLIPSFVNAIGRVILGGLRTPSGTQTSNVLDENNTPVVILRRACIKMLATLVCLPNHYPGVKFQSAVPEKQNKLPALTSFDEVHSHQNANCAATRAAADKRWRVVESALGGAVVRGPSYRGGQQEPRMVLVDLVYLYL